MKVLVCGGRTFTDRALLNAELDDIHRGTKVTALIHGGARGADTISGYWAEAHGIPVTVFRANWNRDGKRAGPIRNARMLKEGKPDLVVAFPGGAGTAHMMSIAKKAGVPVIEIVRF